MKTIAIKNLSAMKAFAKKFAGELHGGDVVGLVGDLGAGKTTFVQLLAAAMGVKASVKSPTFILMQVFATGADTKKKKISSLCHVDAYRLKSWEELQTIGFEEYAGERSTATLVEWADRVPEVRAFPAYKELTFTVGKNDARTVTIKEQKQK